MVERERNPRSAAEGADGKIEIEIERGEAGRDNLFQVLIKRRFASTGWYTENEALEIIREYMKV